jgi:uncharacterized membrane protein YccC
MTGLTIHDPDGVIRHRAIRTTIAMTAGFAFGVLVLDDVGVALFGSFGAFALLGLADFGGDARARTRDYLALAGVGAVLVAVGTSVSELVLLAALVLFVITFAIRLLAVFGGAFAAGGPAALLVFVVAVMVPGHPDQIAPRELGWVLSSALSIALATWLWPVHQRQVIRLSIADIVDGLGAYVRDLAAPARAAGVEDDADTTGATTGATTGDGRRSTAALADQIRELRDRYGRSATRPAGPTQHDQGLIRLVDQLERSIAFAGRTPPPAVSERVGADVEAAVPIAVDDVALAESVAQSLERTASVLRATTAPEVDERLVACRDDHRARLDRWVAAVLAAGFGADIVIGRLREVFPLRVLSHSVLAGATDAVVSVGGEIPTDVSVPVDVPRADGARTLGRRTAGLVRPHLRPSSVVFRNAIRGAAALSVALVVADAVHAEHGFWVVLGTLTVLKSSAMRTGITAVQAVGGVALGFAVAAIVMVTAGSEPVVLWVLLPITIFVAVYAPAAIHFVAGQAAFTVLVVVLFNILAPQGWVTGLVRVESVALGAAISVVVGIVFWPRGNRRALHDTTAELYRSVATYLGGALRTVTGAASLATLGDERRVALAAEERADQAIFDLLVTPSATASLPAWARLIGVGRSLRLVADGVGDLTRLQSRPIADAGSHRSLDRLADTRVLEIEAVARRIDGADPTLHASRPEAPGSWFEDLDLSDALAVERTVGLVWAVEWLGVVDALVGLDDEPLAIVTAAADVPWWR